MSNNLHLKYRPQSLDTVVGNADTVQALRTSIERKSLNHAILLCGPSGCGKTTLSRIIAKELGCAEQDFFEFDAGKDRSIATMRTIVGNVAYAPMAGKVKVYLLDECHTLLKDAQNALLKSLEDCPQHVYWILATTNPESLLNTIKTRCATYTVQALRSKDLSLLLKRVLKEEGVEGYPDKLVAAIVSAAEGCPREALKILDSVIDIEDDEAALKAITSVKGDEVAVKELCQLLVGDEGKKWERAQKMLPNIPGDPEAIRRQILGYMNAVMLNGKNKAQLDRINVMIQILSPNLYDSGKAGLTSAIYLACEA